MAEAAQQLPAEEEIELTKMELESYAYAKGLRKGREAGVEEGREEGRKAHDEARAAMLTTLLALLAQRGIELDPVGRARIDACVDLGQLSQWLLRAATAASTAELFADA